MADADTQRTNVPLFAVTNAAELLERSAYYGFTSILALYLDSLGYKGLAIGAISVILLALPYVIPVLSAPLAEKLGYKPVMLVALACYASGFAVLSTSSAIGAILPGVTLVALGAGGFKPVATATIAHVTAERHRSFGFTIYYTCINVGGFAGPLAVGFLTDSYRAGFLVAGAIMATALLLTLLAYRSPQPPQRETSIGAAFAKLGTILEDRRLVILLLVFSGFWFLYSMNFSFLVLYLDDFVGLPSWFKPNLQQAYNPLIIIALAIPIGAFATKREPRAMMTVGVLLYVIGFTLLGFVQHLWAFFAGLAIATLGEILAYPAFLSYIASIAPKDRVAVYQSYGFLPLFIGFFFGPLAVGKVYDDVAVGAGRPELFWAVPITVGLLALVGFLATAQPKSGASRKPLLVRAAVVLLLIPLLFAAAWAMPTDKPEILLGDVPLATVEGSTNEGQASPGVLGVPANATALGAYRFELTWKDEAPSGNGVRNQPDTFRLDVRDEGGHLASGTAANREGVAGRLVVTLPAKVAVGALHATVTLVTAGDQTVSLPLAGPRTLAADTSNAWKLTASMQVAAEPS